MIRTIAIVFGDNDFGNTFVPLLKSVYLAYMEHKDYLSKKDLIFMIQSGVEYHYIAFQCRALSEYDAKTLSYIYLDTEKILFDEEAELSIQTKDYDGGAWYLEIQTGNVYSY